jgi:hypothetical protein
MDATVPVEEWIEADSATVLLGQPMIDLDLLSDLRVPYEATVLAPYSTTEYGAKNKPTWPLFLVKGAESAP